MYLFILGVVFGVGLIHAYDEIQLQLWLHKERKLKKAQDEAIAVTIPDTCGCHFSWDDHERYMLAGTTATSTPDTEWWDVMGVDGKPSGIKMEKPKSDEDYW